MYLYVYINIYSYTCVTKEKCDVPIYSQLHICILDVWVSRTNWQHVYEKEYIYTANCRWGGPAS